MSSIARSREEQCWSFTKRGNRCHNRIAVGVFCQKHHDGFGVAPDGWTDPDNLPIVHLKFGAARLAAVAAAPIHIRVQGPVVGSAVTAGREEDLPAQQPGTGADLS